MIIMFYNLLGKLCQGTRITQYITVLIVGLAISIVTTYFTWASPIIPKLTSDDSPLDRPLTSEETSWIVSCLVITGLPTSFVFHIVVGRLGRKQVLQISSIFLFVPWFLIIFAKDVIYIYIGRSIAGLGISYTIISVTMYTAEVSDSDIRGRLGTSYGIMKLLGSTIVFSIGPYLSYQILSTVCALFPMVFFLLLFFVPESPYFLIRNNRIDEAKEALIYLSGTDDPEIINRKLEAISKYVECDEKPLTMMEVLSNRRYFKVLAIVITVVNLDYLGGALVLGSYFETIIAKSQSIVSHEVSSIIFGLIQIPSGNIEILKTSLGVSNDDVLVIISAVAIDKLGRKVVVYIGGTGCVIALIAEGVYFYLEATNADISTISWIPTSGIVMYIIMHSVNGSVPYILVGECFPDRIKNVAITLFLIFGNITVFIVTKTFEPMANAWGLYTVFWIYAIFTIGLVGFTYFFLPETKGKTFAEIEQILYK